MYHTIEIIYQTRIAKWVPAKQAVCIVCSPIKILRACRALPDLSLARDSRNFAVADRLFGAKRRILFIMSKQFAARRATKDLSSILKHTLKLIVQIILSRLIQVSNVPSGGEV